MSGTCCGRRAARVTTQTITQSLEGLEASIQDPGSGEGALQRDPNCECDPCMCPSDDVPCNARYLGDDLSDQGLRQALDRLVRQARQVQAAQGDGCGCADRPPYVEPEPEPEALRSRNRPTQLPPPPQFQRQRPTFLGIPPEVRNLIYRLYFEDLDPLVNEIAAVRVRQGKNALDTRIVRNLTRTRREYRRHILDIHNYPERRAWIWLPYNEPWQREMAAITYEPSASDKALEQFPADRLGLLTVSRLVRAETVGLFFSQRFRFTHPREENMIRWDANIHHGIMAAETFFTNRPQWFLDQFSEIELDLTVAPPARDPPPVGRPGGMEVMRAPADDRIRAGEYNWTDGLMNLPSLANILDRMPFQHLRLNFGGAAPRWREEHTTVSGRILVPNRGFALFYRVKLLLILLRIQDCHWKLIKSAVLDANALDIPGPLLCSTLGDADA